MTACEDIKEKISLLIDNELEEEEARKIKEHIEGCEDCARLYEEMKLIASELKAIEEIEPPKELHNSIMKEVRAVKKEKKKISFFDFKQLLPTAACFVIMCVVTVTLTDMQNNKISGQAEQKIMLENSEGKQNSGAEPNVARSLENNSNSAVYEKKLSDIIIEKKEIKLDLDKNESNLKAIEEICKEYDYETKADRESFVIDLMVLKDMDYDSLLEKLPCDYSVVKEDKENKTEEYNSIFEEISSEKDKAKLNALYEKAFNLEMDMDYYKVKLVFDENINY